MSSISQPISVVIPTYNGKHLLQRNIPAVISCLRDQDEIVIVDDHGTDSTTEWLSDYFSLQPQTRIVNGKKWKLLVGSAKQRSLAISVVVLINRKNLRFALSCNRGVQLARHNHIFLLNNDVSPFPDVLTHALPHFADQNTFAVSCQEIESAQGGLLSGNKRLWFERGLFRHARGNPALGGLTDWVGGGSTIFDRSKWLALGGFDPQFYPAYWEDVDLSYRARLRGWKLIFEPRAKVYHNHETTNVGVFGQLGVEAMSWRNGLLFTRKHARGWRKLQFWIFRPYWWWVWRRHLRNNHD